MGVRFAMERRNWKLLLKDRTLRILVPYLFGIAVLGPLLLVGLPRLGWDAEYTPNFGHLWFLLNIFLYVIWLLGLFAYLKDHPKNPVFRVLSKVMQSPMGLFVFISLEEVFWPAVVRTRWVAVAVAALLYLLRLKVFGLDNEIAWLTGLECMSWILAAFGFGAMYLNRPSRGLSNFSGAAYPIYIVHLPVQFSVAFFLLPAPMTAPVKFGVMLVGTFAISVLIYEYALRRLRWVRPLFGMKLRTG